MPNKLQNNEYKVVFNSDIERSRERQARKKQKDKEKLGLTNYEQKTKALKESLGFGIEVKKVKYNPNWKEDIKEFDKKYIAKPVYKRNFRDY